MRETCDEQLLPALSSEATLKFMASESFADLRKLKRKDLDTLGMLTTYQKHKVPTLGGFLLYGIDRIKNFPDAWIQAGHFRGLDRSSIIDQLACIWIHSGGRWLMTSMCQHRNYKEEIERPTCIKYCQS